MLACAYLFTNLDQVNSIPQGATEVKNFNEFGKNLKPIAEEAHTVHRLTNSPKVGYYYREATSGSANWKTATKVMSGSYGYNFMTSESASSTNDNTVW